MSFARCRGWEKGDSHLTLELEGVSSTPCMAGNARTMFPWHLHSCVCSRSPVVLWLPGRGCCCGIPVPVVIPALLCRAREITAHWEKGARAEP